MSATGRGRLRCGARAFTLVELVVVTVLILVLAGMIVPRLHRAAGSTQLRVSARRLACAARWAREVAITRRCRCRLVIDARKQRWALARDGADAEDPARFVAMTSALGRAEQLPAGVRFGRVEIEARRGEDLPQGADDCVTFDAFGGGDAAAVELTDGRRAFSVLVWPHTGRTELVEGPAGSPPDDRLDLDG